jgi:hypothetical protein
VISTRLSARNERHVMGACFGHRDDNIGMIIKNTVSGRILP